MASADRNPTEYRHRDRVAIKRALISVSDKTGLLELAGVVWAVRYGIPKLLRSSERERPHFDARSVSST